MHSVAQAAKDAGQPLRRSQLCWVLERAKGDERVAISLATSQASARRALPVLRDPSLLSNFDVSAVTPAMARRVKETLSSVEALQTHLAELSALDEEAGEAVGRRVGERPQVGDTVLVLSSRDDEASRFVGMAGRLEEDDGSSQPFLVLFPSGGDYENQTWWFYEGEIEASELLAGIAEPIEHGSEATGEGRGVYASRGARYGERGGGGGRADVKIEHMNQRALNVPVSV